MQQSKYIGLVCGAITGTIFAIINPDSDDELDNPRWLLIQIGHSDGTPPPPEKPEGEMAREPIMLLRCDRAEYMACTHHDQVQVIAHRLRREL